MIFSGQILRKCSILSNLLCVCMNSYSSPNVFYGLDIQFARFGMVHVSVWRHRYDKRRHKLIFWLLSPISEEMIYIETSRQLVSSNSSRNALLGLTIRVCLIWHDLRVGVTSSIRVWRRKLICWGSYKGKYSTLQAYKKAI